MVMHNRGLFLWVGHGWPLIFYIIIHLTIFSNCIEDQKTKAQLKREQELLDELVLLVNEREWLDQRLTNTTQ